jgi:hypothetical protein
MLTSAETALYALFARPPEVAESLSSMALLLLDLVEFHVPDLSLADQQSVVDDLLRCLGRVNHTPQRRRSS